MAYLYSVLVLAIVAASVNCSAISDEQREAIKQKMQANAMACGTELGISQEQLKKWKEEKPTPGEQNKCFLACMFKKSGFLDDQGLFSENAALEKIKSYIPADKQDAVVSAVKTCTSVNDQAVSDGSAGCDRAVLLYKCLKEQKEALGLTVDFEH